MSRAYAQCEQLCRLLFRRELRNVPAEPIVNLIMTTDRFVIGSRTVSTSAQSNSQRAKPLMAPAPLVWSVALIASRDITIQASIEYVVSSESYLIYPFVLRIRQSRKYIDPTDKPIRLTIDFPLGYWRNLWSSLDFADRPLKSCMSIIHVDIVEIWNVYDKIRVSSP